MSLFPTTVLVVDDSPAVREALRWALEDEPDLTVVGEASDSEEAIRCARELSPAAVLLDIQLPGRDGFAVARSLKAMPQPPYIIFLSVHTTPSYRQRAAQAGGDAFVEKSAGWPTLIARLRDVVRQQIIADSDDQT